MKLNFISVNLILGKKCKSLTSLILGFDVPIGSNICFKLLRVVSNICLTSLRLDSFVSYVKGNEDKTSFMQSFCDYISNNRHLKTISIDCNNLNRYIDQNMLLKAFSKSSSLTTVDLRLLSQTRYTNLDFLKKITCIDLNSITFDLFECDILRCFIRMFSALKQNHFLKTLHLSFLPLIFTEKERTFIREEIERFLTGCGTVTDLILFGVDYNCFDTTVERNKSNLNASRTLCETMLAAKRFRKSPYLANFPKDISTLICKHLFQTRGDYESWKWNLKQKN